VNRAPGWSACATAREDQATATRIQTGMIQLRARDRKKEGERGREREKGEEREREREKIRERRRESFF
jgi:hypothetical protein